MGRGVLGLRGRGRCAECSRMHVQVTLFCLREACGWLIRGCASTEVEHPFYLLLTLRRGTAVARAGPVRLCALGEYARRRRVVGVLQAPVAHPFAFLVLFSTH